MKILVDDLTGARFNDWVENNEPGFPFQYWAPVCDAHAKEHSMNDPQLEQGAYLGICGIDGCDHEANYQYDFDAEEEKEQKPTHARRLR